MNIYQVYKFDNELLLFFLKTYLKYRITEKEERETHRQIPHVRAKLKMGTQSRPPPCQMSTLTFYLKCLRGSYRGSVKCANLDFMA